MLVHTRCRITQEFSDANRLHMDIGRSGLGNCMGNGVWVDWRLALVLCCHAAQKTSASKRSLSTLQRSLPSVTPLMDHGHQRNLLRSPRGWRMTRLSSMLAQCLSVPILDFLWKLMWMPLTFTVVILRNASFQWLMAGAFRRDATLATYSGYFWLLWLLLAALAELDIG
ncbi:hypothetical protein BR93DRAFT_177490 [Coniochaeta sp. PMI_546]|nr:hypothetical protein BR93DRAFT_177490 [Coniochaeta sp. PMI_546]